MKSALILYPHQLFEAKALPQTHTIFMVEEPLFFGSDREYPSHPHKQKAVLHRASMRRYVEEVLWPMGSNVEYIDLDVLYSTGDIIERAQVFDQLYFFDLIDDTLTKRILQARREHAKSPAIEFLPSPNFYLKDQEIRQYLNERHEHVFDEFYQWQRERFNILIGEDYKPVGGKWSFESERRSRVPKDQQLPSFGVFGDDKHTKEVVEWANKRFPDNPGSTDFIWPTSHAEAANWLHDFVEHRLDSYGKYEDALDGQAAWLFHSALSASLNIGLLSPQQVVEAALARHAAQPVNLVSLESFIRQIIGWREFMRGQYVVKGTSLKSTNTFKHQRRLTPAWYEGTTGIPPFDDMMQKVKAHGYAHHSERLMIAGNLMLLCEIEPGDVYRWFSELFIDSYPWVTVPNVYGLSQFGDGGAYGGKPYIAASNYILQMSHYERGIWSDVWDGLFWRFVDKHRTVLAHNPRMRTMISRLDRLDPDRRRIISYRAEDFLNKFTA